MHNNNRFRIRKEGRANDIRYIVTFIRSCWCWHIPFQQMFSSLNTYCIHIFLCFQFLFEYPFPFVTPNTQNVCQIRKKLRQKYDTAQQKNSPQTSDLVTYSVYFGIERVHITILNSMAQGRHIWEMDFAFVSSFPFLSSSFPSIVCVSIGNNLSLSRINGLTTDFVKDEYWWRVRRWPNREKLTDDETSLKYVTQGTFSVSRKKNTKPIIVSNKIFLVSHTK